MEVSGKISFPEMIPGGMNESTDKTVKKYYTVMKDYELQKKSLQRQLDLGIMSNVDTVTELNMISKKELTIKRKLVEKVHLTSSGRQATISVGKPNKPELFMRDNFE